MKPDEDVDYVISMVMEISSCHVLDPGFDFHSTV